MGDVSSADPLRTCAELLISEHAALAKALDRLLKNTRRLSVSEIVDTYYKAIRLKSAATALERLQAGRDATGMVQKSRELVEGRFNLIFHPRIATELSDAIRECTDKLLTERHEVSRSEAEEESHAYAMLREAMSTREFVMQYERSLESG